MFLGACIVHSEVVQSRRLAAGGWLRRTGDGMDGMRRMPCGCRSPTPFSDSAERNGRRRTTHPTRPQPAARRPNSAELLASGETGKRGNR
jgi:hypothetical protein